MFRNALSLIGNRRNVSRSHFTDDEAVGIVEKRPSERLTQKCIKFIKIDEFRPKKIAEFSFPKLPELLRLGRHLVFERKPLPKVVGRHTSACFGIGIGFLAPFLTVLIDCKFSIPARLSTTPAGWSENWPVLLIKSVLMIKEYSGSNLRSLPMILLRRGS